MKATNLSRGLRERIAYRGRDKVVLVKRDGKRGWTSAFIPPSHIDAIHQKLRAGYQIVEGGRVYPNNVARTKRHAV